MGAPRASKPLPARDPKGYEKHNRLVMADLRSTIRGLSRATIISTGAAAFRAAVEATYQDSGRAAHNVNMFAKGKLEQKSPMLEYGEPPVGVRGEKRSEPALRRKGLQGQVQVPPEAVIKERLNAYGIPYAQLVPAYSKVLADLVGDPGEMLPMTGGRVYAGFAGTKIPEVSVYSPITPSMFEGHYARHAYGRDGRPTAAEAARLAVNKQVAFLQNMLGRIKSSESLRQHFLKTYYQSSAV